MRTSAADCVTRTRYFVVNHGQHGAYILHGMPRLGRASTRQPGSAAAKGVTAGLKELLARTGAGGGAQECLHLSGLFLCRKEKNPGLGSRALALDFAMTLSLARRLFTLKFVPATVWSPVAPLGEAEPRVTEVTLVLWAPAEGAGEV